MSQQQQHPISDFTHTSMESLRSLVDVNTIIGDPISTADGVVIIPISKVSFGYASGGSDIPSAKQSEVFGGATGGGVTIQPLAFLVVSGGDVKLLQMQSADNTGDRIVNAIPGLMDQLIGLVKKDGKNAQDAPEDASAE